MSFENNVVLRKSFEFAIKVVEIGKTLYTNHEYIISKQFIRAGTSIGANITESKRAQTEADFYSKLTIALKEADETQYWLELLFSTKYISQEDYIYLYNDLQEIISLLVSITKTLKEKLKK